MRTTCIVAFLTMLVALPAGAQEPTETFSGSVPMADIFYQVEPWDRSVFAIVAVILTVTGLLAIFLPARRATKVDPMEALRYQNKTSNHAILSNLNFT